MLKYICLSDLHAGSISSLLRKLETEDHGRNTGGSLSPITHAFQRALEGFLLAAGAKDTPPQMVLMGDVLELQFATREEAFPIALGFLSALNRKKLLQGEVIATAGNHDHSLWTDARLSLDANRLSVDGMDADYRSATPAFEKSSGESRLLSALLLKAGFSSCDFRYPNIGFRNDQRLVLLHHGHFVEKEYRALSMLMDAFAQPPRDPGAIDIDTLCAENAGWIDFAWAALGDAAGLGKGAEQLYQNMLTTNGFRRMSKHWSKVIAAGLSEALPLSGNLMMQEAIHTMCQVGIDASIGQFRDTERYTIVDSLSYDGLQGLKWYVEGPCAKQIASEHGTIPEDVTFVFGHTHKPFSQRVAMKGYPGPVKVYNTGGWALNGPRLDNAQGAAMILIDDQLNVASLRLFMTPHDDEVRPAYVEMLSDGPGSETFRDEINEWLGASEKAWVSLARAAEKAYVARQEMLLAYTDTDLPSTFRGAAE
jgi:predicted phosphodiesterase